MARDLSLAQIGLEFDPDDSELQVLYNAPAETLIAILVPRRSRHGDKRIFVRQLREECYRELSLQNEFASVKNVALCSDRPLMFFSVYAYRDATRAGADFGGIGRVSLPDGMIERLPLPVLVDTPQWEGPAIPTDLWIEEIVAVSGDGHRLHVIAAIHVPTGETLHSARVERWLSTFEVYDGGLRPFAELPAMFA